MQGCVASRKATTVGSHHALHPHYLTPFLHHRHHSVRPPHGLCEEHAHQKFWGGGGGEQQCTSLTVQTPEGGY